MDFLVLQDLTMNVGVANPFPISVMIVSSFLPVISFGKAGPDQWDQRVASWVTPGKDFSKKKSCMERNVYLLH